METTSTTLNAKSKNTQLICVFLFFVGICLSLYMFKTLMIHTDNLQMMDKAVKYMTTGEFAHFGNQATKVGSIPGSLLTFLSAVPMKFWPTPYAAMAMILLFHVLSMYFLKKSADLISSSYSLLVLLVFYWLNPWRVEQSELYNPGYLFLFSTVHIYTALNMKEKNFWATFWNVAAIGFCMQIHFSFLILAFCSLLLFFTRQIKVNWVGFTTGCVVVAASLVPYYLAKFSHQAAGQSLDFTKSDAFFGRNLVLVYPVLKAIVYYFRMGSAYFGRHIFSEIRFDWIATDSLRMMVSGLFHALKWLVAVTTLWLSGKAMVLFFKEKFKTFKWKKPEIPSNQTIRFENYFYILFISMILTSGLSPVEFNHWHLILCFPAIILFLTLKLNVKPKFIYALAGVFIVWNIFAAMGSRSHSYKNDYQRDFFEHYKTELNYSAAE